MKFSYLLLVAIISAMAAGVFEMNGQTLLFPVGLAAMMLFFVFRARKARVVYAYGKVPTNKGKY